MNTIDLPYIDIQHDAMTVIDDVEQGVVPSEDIWVSAYKRGSSSVHGKVKVNKGDGGRSELSSRAGVQVAREGKTTFITTFPALKLDSIPVRFPRHTLVPPYEKKTDVSPALIVNSLAYSAKRQKLAIAGPDGYLCLMSTSASKHDEAPVLLKGHVGDVLDVKFFPSGEVILSASSDLSIRIFGLDGSNPRTLQGHTRAVTCTAILGVGKEIISGSRDGTVRLWNVGQEKQVRKWFINPPRAVEAIFVDTAGGDGREKILALRADGIMQVFDLNNPQGGDVTIKLREEAALVSAAWDQERRILATGHSDGIITLRRIPLDIHAMQSAITTTDTSTITTERMPKHNAQIQIRRNEASIYSLLITSTGNLCVGTAAGLPCRLSVTPPVGEHGEWEIGTAEEIAGWDAAGIEAMCAMDDKGIAVGGPEPVVRIY